MDRRHAGGGAPPGDRDQLKRAFGLAAMDPKARPPIPYAYFIDQLERRYGQPPGSARTWEPDDFLRAAAFMRLEASVRKG